MAKDYTDNVVDGEYTEINKDNFFDKFSDDISTSGDYQFTLDTGEVVQLTDMEHVMVEDILNNGSGTDADKKEVINNLLKARENTDERKAMFGALHNAKENGCEIHDLRKFVNDYSQVSESIQDVDLSHKARRDIIDALEKANEKAEKEIKNANGKENVDEGKVQGIYKKALQDSQQTFKSNLKANIQQGADERAALKKVTQPTDKTKIIQGIGGIGNSFAQAMDDPFKAMVSFSVASAQLTINIVDFHRQRKANQEQALNKYISQTGTYKEADYRSVSEKVENTDVELRKSFGDMENQLKKGSQSEKNLNDLLDMEKENKLPEGLTVEATYDKDGKIEKVAFNMDNDKAGNISIEYDKQNDKFTYNIGDSKFESREDAISGMKTKSFEQSLYEMSENAKSTGQDISVTLGKDDGFTKDFTITANKEGQLSIKHGNGIENKLSAKDITTTLEKDAGKAVGKTRNATAKVAKTMEKAAVKTTKSTAKAVAKAAQTAKTAISASNPYTAAAKAVIDVAKKLITSQVQHMKSRQASATSMDGPSL